MQNTSSLKIGNFSRAFEKLIRRKQVRAFEKEAGLRRRRPPKLSVHELIMSLVFHFLNDRGYFSSHIRQMSGKKISDSAVSQRRGKMPWDIFDKIMKVALKPLAQITQKKHSGCFYHGYRLIGIDGTQFSLSNTPRILAHARKAVSRRLKAAFAKMGACVLVELGFHNPVAVDIARNGESEGTLARRLLEKLPEVSLLLADRLYGVGVLIAEILEVCRSRQSAFLIRVRSNLKTRLIERQRDGSAIVEVRLPTRKTIWVREVRGWVRTRNGKRIQIRLWTSLLDPKKHPAMELLKLYAQRWEQELFFKELKVEMGHGSLLASHLIPTAAQEVAAMILAHAMLVQFRVQAGALANREVLKISFVQTLEMTCSLWATLQATEDMLSLKQQQIVTQRYLRLMAQQPIVPRRQRSCPRAVRQPIKSWPRLIKNTYHHAPFSYEITPLPASIS